MCEVERRASREEGRCETCSDACKRLEAIQIMLVMCKYVIINWDYSFISLFIQILSICLKIELFFISYPANNLLKSKNRNLQVKVQVVSSWTK